MRSPGQRQCKAERFAVNLRTNMVLRFPLEEKVRTTLMFITEDVLSLHLVLEFCQCLLTGSPPPRVMNNGNGRLGNKIMQRRRAIAFYKGRPLVVRHSRRVVGKRSVPLATISMPPLCNRSPEKFPSTPSALAYRTERTKKSAW